MYPRIPVKTGSNVDATIAWKGRIARSSVVSLRTLYTSTSSLYRAIESGVTFAGGWGVAGSE